MRALESVAVITGVYISMLSHAARNVREIAFAAVATAREQHIARRGRERPIDF